MTDLIVAKSVAGMGGTLTTIASVVAVIDPSIQNIAVAFIGAVVTITTVVFAFKTAALNRKTVELDTKIKEVEKSSNGMQAALLVAGARANLAEGKEQGRNAQKLEDQATAMGRELATRVPAAGGESANTAKVAEIIAVVDANVKEVDKKVEVIDENVKEVHETVVKQTEIKTKT